VAANNPETFNQLALVWGVKSYLIDSEKNIDDFINQLADRGKEEKILEAGDKVVVILGKGPNNEKMRLIGVKEIS
jgi:pyruvate kinase